MSFRLAATLVALIYVILFICLLFMPATYMATYGVISTEAAAFMSRRAAPMMLGLAVLMWFARDVRMSPAREAIRLCIIVIFAGIAATGIAEYLMGHASWPILIAATGELVVAGVFLWGIRAE